MLTDLLCDSNQLTCLNVKNGNNANFIYFEAQNNPNLTCIEVDDVVYSTNNWWPFIDPQTSFSSNCTNPCIVGINNLEKFSDLTFYPNPTTGNISIDLGEIKTNIKAVLTNSLGQILSTQKYGSIDYINMDIDGPRGIYFLQLETAKGETKTLKVLKE